MQQVFKYSFKRTIFSKMLTPFLLSATDLFSCDVLCVGCYEEPGLAEALCGLAAPASGDQGTAAPLVAK